MRPRSLLLTLLASLASLTTLSAQRGTPSGPRGGGMRPTAGESDRAIGGMASGNPAFGEDRGSGHFDRSAGGRLMPPRPNGAPPVRSLGYFRGTRVIYPPAFQRCTVVPDMTYWGTRDIMAEIQWLARAGFIPVIPVEPGAEFLSDFTWRPAGWKAYGFAVPAGGKLQVEVEHAKLAWFRLMAVNKWGEPGPGMLQASIAYRPVMVTVSNPRKEADCVYIIVDDPGWWSDKENPYTLHIRRDWDPATADLKGAKMVAGIWGASPSVSAQFQGPSLTGPAVFPH